MSRYKRIFSNGWGSPNFNQERHGLWWLVDHAPCAGSSEGLRTCSPDAWPTSYTTAQAWWIHFRGSMSVPAFDAWSLSTQRIRACASSFVNICGWFGRDTVPLSNRYYMVGSALWIINRGRGSYFIIHNARVQHATYWLVSFVVANDALECYLLLVNKMAK